MLGVGQERIPKYLWTLVADLPGGGLVEMVS